MGSNKATDASCCEEAAMEGFALRAGRAPLGFGACESAAHPPQAKRPGLSGCAALCELGLLSSQLVSIKAHQSTGPERVATLLSQPGASLLSDRPRGGWRGGVVALPAGQLNALERRLRALGGGSTPHPGPLLELGSNHSTFGLFLA